MKKWLFSLSVILVLGLSACGSGIDADQSDQPKQAPQAEQAASLPAEQAAGSDSAEFLEQTSGSLTARIFSAQETTINQRKVSLQGWVNHAAVISVNDIIAVTDTEDEFSVELQLESGPNLVEVLVSDQDGNEVRFEIIIYVEE